MFRSLGGTPYYNYARNSKAASTQVWRYPCHSPQGACVLEVGLCRTYFYTVYLNSSMRVLGESGRPWSRQLGPCCRPTPSFSPRMACSTAPWPEAWQRASHGHTVSCPAVICRRHGRRPQPAALPGRADRVLGSYTGGC